MSSSASRVDLSGRPVSRARLDGPGSDRCAERSWCRSNSRPHSPIAITQLAKLRPALPGPGADRHAGGSDRCPDVGVSFGGAEHFAHSLWRVEMLRKPTAPRARSIFEHLVLPLGKPRVVEMAMAVDRPHAASSSSSSSRGKNWLRLGDGPSRRPPIDEGVRSLSAAVGITGTTAWVSRRTAGERAEHRLHAVQVRLPQRPGRLGIDIGIARRHCGHPRLQAHGEGQPVETFGHFRADARSLAVHSPWGFACRRERTPPKFARRPSTMCAAQRFPKLFASSALTP